MSDKREPVAWITKNGKHIPIFADSASEDEIRKAQQIKANKAQADEKNGKPVKISEDYETIRKHYEQFRGDPQKCGMELYERTGINLTGRLNDVDDDTLVVVCATLEDLQRKFHINEAKPIGTDVNRLEVSVPGYYEHSFDGELEDAFAHARMNKISLNSRYYSLNPKEFDEVYAEGTDGYEPFHPKGTTSKDIIAHEAAHHLLDLYVWNKYCKDDEDFDRAYRNYHKIQDFLNDPTEYTGMGEKTAPEIKEIFNKFDKVRLQYVKQMKRDPDAVKYLGHALSENRFLREMSNPIRFGHYAISKYSAKNYHELVAEAFADYYANGKNAKLLSRMLVKEFFGFK